MEIDSLVQLLRLELMRSVSGAAQDSGSMSESADFSLILAAVLSEMEPQPNITQEQVYGQVDQLSNVKKSQRTEQGLESTTSMKPVAERTGKERSDKMEGINVSLQSAIANTAAKYGLDPALLKAVVKVESNFNPRATSRAGAMGLMQLMPGTAAGLGVENPYDIKENLEGGARYLKSLLDKYNGDLKLALAAYNAGPGTVQKYKGIPPYRETMEYVRKVAQSRKEFLV